MRGTQWRQRPLLLGRWGRRVGAVEGEGQEMAEVRVFRVPSEQRTIDRKRDLRPAGAMGGERAGERIGGRHGIGSRGRGPMARVTVRSGRFRDPAGIYARFRVVTHGSSRRSWRPA